MKKRINVLEIFGEPVSSGGQESFVINILNHIDHEKLRIDLLTPYYCDNVGYQNIVELNGGKIFSFGLEFAPGKSRFNINDKIDNFLREHKYDVVHIHSGSISVLSIMSKYARKNGVKKIIVHSHCAAEKKTMKYWLTKIAFTPSMRHNPTDYCACSMVAGEWKFPKRIVEKKLRILKNGVDLDKYVFDPVSREQMRNLLSIPQDAFVLGHVGRFSYQKNHEYLLSVFTEVLKKCNNTFLLLVGDGENRKNIERQIRESGIKEHVVMCGRVDNVNDYMQAMDVFVLPSRYEGLPIVGVEAQASGLPVVTSVNVSEELAITPLVTYLSLEDSPVAWADKVMQYINEIRCNYSLEMRQSGYDIQTTANEIERLYLES